MDEKLRGKLVQNNQKHLVEHYDCLNDCAKKSRFLADLQTLDLSELSQMLKSATEENSDKKCLPEKIADDLCLYLDDCRQDRRQMYREKGLAAVNRGEVGVLVLAGGQGTRLGVNYPKGMVDIGLPSQKSLYQIQAERLLRLERLAETERSIRLYVMTSDYTGLATSKFFAAHNFFGLKESQICFFEQRMIPCFDLDGRILIDANGEMARAPDGNGGLYGALAENGLIDDMERHGILYLHVYCVDNVLVKVADPSLMGFAMEEQAECVNKVVEKVEPYEAVGVVALLDNLVQVIEYSELSKELAIMKDDLDDSKLALRAGNICNHVFSTVFLKRICQKEYLTQMPVHCALKKVPSLTEPSPKTNNCIKLEKFVFDVFQFATPGKFRLFECSRDEEFSPLKNKDVAGANNTATTARNDLFRLHCQYLERAGAEVSGGKNEAGEFVCEISPLVTYEGEQLENVVEENGGKFEFPVHIKEKK